MSEWNAYQCDDSVRYGMLSIESMDHDTETRRLSPVAVFSGGYIDLLNGPQDHGWCSGYTCRKRLSTFPAIVPLGELARIETENKTLPSVVASACECAGVFSGHNLAHGNSPFYYIFAAVLVATSRHNI